MSQELEKYSNDPVLKAQILAEMPKKPETTLGHHKQKFMGHLPGHRKDYDPNILLSKNANGDRVIALGIGVKLLGSTFPPDFFFVIQTP